MDNWDSSYLPTVPQIKAQYKIYNYRSKEKVKKRDIGAETAAKKFKEAYADCIKAGMDNLNDIAKYLESVFSDHKRKFKSTCQNNFCDGNKWIVAVKKNDPMKSEVLFTCKCQIHSKVDSWNEQPGYTIIKGLNPEIKRQEK